MLRTTVELTLQRLKRNIRVYGGSLETDIQNDSLNKNPMLGIIRQNVHSPLMQNVINFHNTEFSFKITLYNRYI
jgi:hypothetical protein